jgi:hypothetical protein
MAVKVVHISDVSDKGLYATKRGPSRRAVRSVCHMIPTQVLRLGARVVPARPVARARG